MQKLFTKDVENSVRLKDWHYRLCRHFSGFFLVVIGLVMPVAAQISKGDQLWSGSYSFEETAQTAFKKRSPTDSAPYVSYEITVNEAVTGKLIATFSVNGTQIFEEYECSVIANNNRIEFYYERFIAEGAKEQKKFQKGALLFTLIKTRSSGQVKYLFQPAEYKITRINKSRQNQPIYFIKQQP